ncbi:MAG: hypothetical protein CMJ64_07040 [Planctomycetaceae bacterium]|nr:hypothetical protein [Planctomycetaceae bacterium]
MTLTCYFARRLQLSLLVFGLLSCATGKAAEKTRFESDIQPILRAKCFVCHGDEKQKGGLSLASLLSLTERGESGSAVLAGKPDESLLLKMIQEGEMPPEGEGLSAEQIGVLRRWIEDGTEIRKVQRERAITQHRIIPLMLLRCTACHGGRRREADLDLRSKAGMIAGGKSGPAVLPGKPGESLLIKRIRAEQMPPRRQLVSVSVKPMDAGELAVLEAWIAAGLPESPVGPDVATTDPDPLISNEDREHWAFQPPRAQNPVAREVRSGDGGLAENSIDYFIMSKRREHDIATPGEADKRVLIRRVYFDLIGLPPSLEEVETFVASDDPRSYERLVDRLLASPRYGERWARHWLDVAGYADSEGSQNEDRIRPRMWRYRDYVIRAFDSDKPYDRFLHEQIAGDELADYESAKVITDEIYDNLVATGFLRTTPDRTFANITNFVPDRLELIADEIQVLGSAVMGLTLQCARCHSHKFDPIPQRDYYRLAATLKDALDEHDWLGPQARSLNFVTTEERKLWEGHEAGINEQIAAQKKKLESDDAAKKKLEESIKQLEAQRKPEPRIRALWSRGQPSPTHILKRGNYLTPGREVGPGVPSMLTDGQTPLDVKPPWPGAKQSGRRLALARWLTEPDHPLTARVIVNRIWKHHFGQALVATPGNFGVTGAKPTHPELLDWLAVEFVRQGWSIKALHRLILTSHTYRMSSQVTPESLAADPENGFYSRMNLRRLEAEPLRDSLLSVADELSGSAFGSPDDVDARADGLVTSKRLAGGWRRSIYVLHRRTKLPTLLESFDSPQMGPNCIERDESIVAPQALHLLNDAMVYQLASRFAERIEREAGDDVEAQVRRGYLIALGQEPTSEVVDAAREILAEIRKQWLVTLKDQSDCETEAAHRALTNLCHAIMNSAAFVYVD